MMGWITNMKYTDKFCLASEDGQLQACGSNNKGQLGLGHLRDVSELTTITHFSATKITQVAAGWDFSLAVTEEGHVFTFGSNAFGQLGNPSLPQKCSTPTRIEIQDNKPVMKVAAGLRHSVALTEDGSVYCWGHAKKGQCGCVSGETQILKITAPTKVVLPEIKGRITDIVAGSYHTAALSDVGEVLVWGCNKYGQTTQNPESCLQVNSPFIIRAEMFQGHKVNVIRSGWTHLIAQTESGDLYSWGRADYCQLGRLIPKETLLTPTPGLMDTPEKIKDFQCGSEHALFLSGKVEAPEKIVDFKCGSEHALFLSETQKCYAVGWNEHGLCGTGDEQNVSQLRLVDVLKDYSVIKIGCGGGHCFAITESKQSHLSEDNKI